MRFCLFLCCWIAGSLMAVSHAATNTASSTGTSSGAEKLLYNLDASYVPDDKHVLEPGDRISFRVVEDRDPAIALIVADSRELDVPYVGRVSVANKTCKQLVSELKTLLEKEYYYRATVIMAVDMVNKIRGKVYVLGQVRQQGPVDLLFNENLTAGKAILRAGGFGDFANKEKVKVVHNSTTGEKKPPVEINMVNVLEKGKVELDIVLEPDDYVVVPQRAFVY